MDFEPVNLEISKGVNFGPITIRCKSGGVDVPLAGYSAYAHVRKSTRSALLIDLEPVIQPDDSTGTITIPEIPHTSTDDFPAMDAKWDLILEDENGKRLGPILGGRIAINQPITQPA